MPLTLASNAITFTDNTSLSSGIISTAQLSAGAVTGDKISIGYLYTTTLYYNTPGTALFIKANYPWLRAIRVKCQGGGGGGGGAAATGASQVAIAGAGGGGAYAESFITNIQGLSSFILVSVGAGGAGGTAGNNTGTSGDASSFGFLISASGGDPGSGGVPGSGVNYIRSSGVGGSLGLGELIVPGGAGGVYTSVANNVVYPPIGGNAVLGAGGYTASITTGTSGFTANGFGGGGGGGINAQNQGTARAGAPGGNGIVIIELYA